MHEQLSLFDEPTEEQDDSYDKHEDFNFIWDSGKQDADFERLGIKKPSLTEQSEILHKMGYVVTWPK